MNKAKLNPSGDFHIAESIVWLSTFLLIAIIAWLLSDIFIHGVEHLNWEFLTTPPKNAGREGGISPIIISTALVLFVCMAVALPLGLGTAILLSEFTRNQSHVGTVISRSLDILAAIPSIVFGLFGNVFFCKILGLGFSILSGGLTLACMVLPILIRATEEGFRSVPNSQIQAAHALGLSKFTSILSIRMPYALPSLAAGFVLGLGRAIAETAALIFTSGYVDRTPESLFDSGRVLSIHIYDLSMNVAGGDKNAYSTALVLLIVIIFLNLAANKISKRYAFKRENT